MSKSYWTESKIQRLLEKDHTMVERSLYQLHQHQLLNEQAKSFNFHGKKSRSKRRGFNMPDKYFLRPYARDYESYGFLTELQVEMVRPRLMKYVKQLTRIANEEFEERLE